MPLPPGRSALKNCRSTTTSRPEAAPARSASSGLMPTSFGMVTSRPWMASRMAVSAETSATVIRTRARSSMRKNCRIAENYTSPVETRRAASPRRGVLPLRAETGQAPSLREWWRTALLFPLIAACAAGPSVHVRHVSDIERLAAGTPRLLEIPDAFNIQHFGNGLVQDFAGRFRIFGANLELDFAKQLGGEPIHADHVVVHEVSLNPRRLQTTFRQQRIGKIAELA